MALTAAQTAEYLRILMEETSDFIMIADADGKPVLFNRAYAEIMKLTFGRELEAGIKPHTLLDDPDLVAYWDMLHARALSGETFTVVYLHETGSGGPRHLSVTFNPIVRDGAVQGFAELTRDVTDLKKTEEALRASQRALMETQEVARIGTYNLDVATGAWTSSPILDRIFGIDGGFERSVEAWVELLHPEDRDRLLAYFQKEVLAKGRRFNREYRIVRHNDGAVRWVHGLGKVYANEAGEPLRMLGTISDITERVELEQRARRSEHEQLRRRYVERVLAAQEEERRRIARGLHDETGQCLASISVRLAALETVSSPEETETEVHALREVVARVSSELDRLSRGLHPYLLEDLGFAAAIRRLAADFERQHGVQTDVQSVGNLDTTSIDKTLATAGYRIVQEALTNIGKHARATTASVVVRHEGARLGIMVEDDGVGFDPDGSHSDGMGLFGIRERVEMLRGSFEIEAGSGAGTVLTVRLPLDEDA